jgi:nucleotide-binding universal stress UspA family protein
MRILLATDFSAFADTARSLVKSMTLPPGSRIRVVHAVEPITTVAIFASSALLTINEVAERESRELVKQTASFVRAEGRQVDGVVGLGRAADVIADECADFKPDLLVVGSRGRGGIASAVLGSVSAELIDRVQCPVLVARTNRFQSIVLAEDGSASAGAGANVIVDLPVFASCAVRVVSVVDAAFPMVLADPGMTDTAVDAFRAYESSLPELRASHAAMARERAAALSRAGISATWEQREGSAASELLTAASLQHADCIVVGSRGQTGVQRLLLGSVARSVLFHAPCSVLIAHPTPTAERRPTDASEHLVARA